jgi:hypothetical protein
VVQPAELLKDFGVRGGCRRRCAHTHPWRGGTGVGVNGEQNDRIASTHVLRLLINMANLKPDVGVSERT